MLIATTQPEMLFDDPLEVELRAILQGLYLCFPMGVKKIAVETDCLIAVQALDAGPESYVCYRHLLHEILSLKVCFEDCIFIYVSRVGNRVAYLLARHVENTTVWWDSPQTSSYRPYGLISIVILDVLICCI